MLLDKVGEGAFGEVYRAWDVTLEREVALKLMRAAQEDPALLQEARMLARLRNPNIVTVYGADRHEARSQRSVTADAGRSADHDAGRGRFDANLLRGQAHHSLLGLAIRVMVMQQASATTPRSSCRW